MKRKPLAFDVETITCPICGMEFALFAFLAEEDGTRGQFFAQKDCPYCPYCGSVCKF